MKKIKKTAKKLSPGAAAEIAYKNAQTAVLEKIADGSLLKELQAAISPRRATVPTLKKPKPSSYALFRHYANLSQFGEGFKDEEFVKEMREKALLYLKKAATEAPEGYDDMTAEFLR